MRRAAALAALLAAACRGGDAPTLATFGALQARQAVTREVDASRRTALVQAAARLGPSVVSVSVQGHRQVEQRSPFDFFMGPPQDDGQFQSFGTGFVVRRDGIILTNQHVVDAADRIVVTLPDGTDLPATLVGEDATTDIAVLKVDRSDLTAAPLGRTSDLMVGEWVVALGNPYRYLLGNAEPTVTVGVVSGLHRHILPTGDQPGLYLDMVQTDAAINPGNSGGPLANALGEVIGVNSSIFSSSGGSVGIGFSIPIERALKVADEIVRRGEMHRAWTGLEVTGRTGARADGGLRVGSVTPGGPADAAGLRVGDRLVAANGRRLATWLDWEAVKLDLAVGDTVGVTVQRAGAPLARRLTVRDLPSVAAQKVTLFRDLQLVTVTQAIREERQLATDRGALIFRASDEVQQSTGLRDGDVILAINNARVESAAEVREAIERLGRTRGFRLYFERQRRILYTDLYF